ncbi:MAG: hypothetical protein RIQ53_4197 [Pseudomonadota bacterium]
MSAPADRALAAAAQACATTAATLRALQQVPCIRLTGLLTEDAQIGVDADGRTVWLRLQAQPVAGLPWRARVPLGSDPAQHQAARDMLPQLRRGAVASVAGQGVRVTTDHDVVAMLVLSPRDVVAAWDPVAVDITGDAAC